MIINFHKRIKSTGCTVLLVLFGIPCAFSQEIPRNYVAHYTMAPISIDGIASESSWRNALSSSDFIDIEGTKIPTYRTHMKMLWDNKNLYIYAQLEEPHVWATLKQRDTVIFYNNDFEVFIDPDGDTHNYMELEMNALNTLWDLFLTKPYRNGTKVLDSWDIQGVRTAVHIDGTLNDPTNTDRGWSVEIALPWTGLTEAASHGEVPVNEFWRINFSRVNWDYEISDSGYSRKKDRDGRFLHEHNWVWSPQGVVNMHEPEHWGYVYFSDKEIDSKEVFSIPQDEYLKWYMYAVYRELLKAGDGFDSLTLNIMARTSKINGREIKLLFNKHSAGWNITAESPFTKGLLMITEDGEFRKIQENVVKSN